MPEYRRFIAYFYEYIDGKRGRNAGFVKAEQRNGVWRLRVQIRSEVWPSEGSHIFGYIREGEAYTALLLGKGYPQKDSMIKDLQITSKNIDINGRGVEALSGMWIPCGEKRCFLSNWEDVEAEPDKIEVSLAREQEEASQEIQQSEQAEETAQEIQQSEPTDEAPQEFRQTEQTEEMFTETEAEEPIDAEQNRAELTQKEAQETDAPESTGELGTSEEAEPEMAAMECEPIREPGNDDQKEKERSRRAAMDQDWNMLRTRSQRLQPFAQADNAEYIRVCPRDIRWLGGRGWPVGQNSFLMQGFYQYRHLLLGRRKDGAYLLGVPGRQAVQIAEMARGFGFEGFLMADRPGYPEHFGYWYRDMSI